MIMVDAHNYYCHICNLWNPHEWWTAKYGPDNNALIVDELKKL